MSVVLTVVLLCGGVINLLWSLHLLRKPEALSQETLMYRWIYARWTLESWRKDSDLSKPRLNRKQIRNFALGNAVISVLLVVIGLWGIVRIA